MPTQNEGSSSSYVGLDCRLKHFAKMVQNSAFTKFLPVECRTLSQWPFWEQCFKGCSSSTNQMACRAGNIVVLVGREQNGVGKTGEGGGMDGEAVGGARCSSNGVLVHIPLFCSLPTLLLFYPLSSSFFFTNLVSFKELMQVQEYPLWCRRPRGERDLTSTSYSILLFNTVYQQVKREDRISLHWQNSVVKWLLMTHVAY